MKIQHTLILFIAIAMIMASCSNKTAQKTDVKLETELDSVCYAMGLDIGGNIKSSGMDKINTDALTKGFNDAFSDVQPLMEKEKLQMFLQGYFMKMRQQKVEKNLKEANEWMEKNKTKTGVITLPSGLQYQVITEGTGPVPTAESTVKTNYKGTLVDGRVFDSSEGKEPITFKVGGVIKGWTEALQMMKVGSKWKLFVPPVLGYGENPRPGGIIEANNVLIFELELIDIVKDQGTPQPK